MVAVEASVVLNEIDTGERMTPGQNQAESHYVAATCDIPMYLFQLDFWTEAFPRHWHEEWGIAVIHQGVNRFWFKGAWHNAGPGAVIVVPPGEVHDGGLDKHSVWGERMCYVPVESMARITEAFICVFVFHRDGEPVKDFRKAWYSACVMAGLGKYVCRKCGSEKHASHKCVKCEAEWKRDELKYVGRIFHDFRRTAVRDMVRAGVRESAAMSISGHKTRSMFDRYNIHDEKDQREALRATQAYREQQAAVQREKIAAMPQRSAGIN